VALALSPIVIGATWAHSGNGWLFAAEDGGWEYPLYLFVLCIAQVMFGDSAEGRANATMGAMALVAIFTKLLNTVFSER